MKYIGNKQRLLTFIEESLKKSNVNYQNVRVLDMFSGTGSVSEFFLKNNCDVISCDIMSYSIAEQYRKLFFRTEPTFEEIKFDTKSEKLSSVLQYLNGLKPIKGYYFDNYAPSGKFGRRYFSDENAQKIDAIRMKIEDWKNKLSREKYMFLLGILMNAADRISNTSGTYGAYLKIWREMALKNIILESPCFIETGKFNVIQSDVIEFASNYKNFDIVYIDPPYNTRQYAANFHVLENIVIFDKAALKGKTGLREYENQKSNFSIKSKVYEEFLRLINEIDASTIVMSYSNEGLLTEAQIVEALSKKGKVDIYRYKYRRFKTNAWTDENKGLEELLFVCRIN